MITGKLIRTGRLKIGNDILVGVFIETTGPDILVVAQLGMYNADVVVMKERRRSTRPVWRKLANKTAVLAG